MIDNKWVFEALGQKKREKNKYKCEGEHMGIPFSMLRSWRGDVATV